MRYGMPVEAVGEMAKKFVEFQAALDEWREKCREDGVVEFPKSKFFNPNTGRLTRNQYEAMEKRWDAGEDVIFPPTYDPVMVEVINGMNCPILKQAISGKNRRQSPPSDWDEKKYGSWIKTDSEGNEYPSGWYIEKKENLRRCHAISVDDLVEDAEHNILKIGSYRYVVGTGGFDGSAIHFLNLHDRLLFKTISRTWVSQCARKIPHVADMVWRVEDRPNVGGAYVIRSKWRTASSAVNELPFFPGQVLTVGHLYDADGNMLTAREIRKIADGDQKGIKFQALNEVLRAEIPWSDAWKEIAAAEGRRGLARLRERPTREEKTTPQEKSKRNAGTQCRTEPCENTPYGLHAVQCNVIPYQVIDEDDNMMLGLAIGARSNHEYKVLRSDAKRQIREAEAAKAKEEKSAKKAARKAAKQSAQAKKSEKKVAKKAVKKATKKSGKKPKPVVAEEPTNLPEEVVAEIEEEIVSVDSAEVEEVIAE